MPATRRTLDRRYQIATLQLPFPMTACHLDAQSETASPKRAMQLGFTAVERDDNLRPAYNGKQILNFVKCNVPESR